MAAGEASKKEVAVSHIQDKGQDENLVVWIERSHLLEIFQEVAIVRLNF